VEGGRGGGWVQKVGGTQFHISSVFVLPSLPPSPSSRYTVKLLKAQSIGVKSGRAIAQGLGTVLFIIFASYGLGMWFGAKEIGKCRGRKEGREGRREGGKSDKFVLSAFLNKILP